MTHRQYHCFFLTAVLLGAVLRINAEDFSFHFEGHFGRPVEDIRNMNAHAPAFLPYKPVIVEIGADEGQGTLELALAYPYGKVFAFEPSPEAYSQLADNTQSLSNVSVFNLAVNTFNGTASLWGEGPQASLLPLEKGEKRIDVPCTVLDDWCKDQGIAHIDFLRLDAGGLEWHILQSSPKVLEKVLVIVTKTHMSPSGRSIPSYSLLKNLLEDQGFKLLSHWYQEKKTGEATFVRQYMYDSIFN
jgi:FkbM family methyltransferase